MRVAVIGAGPAGTIASIVLARGGVEVIVIEQHRFPRDKVCGECLSALGIDVLDRLGLSGSVAKEWHPAILNRTILFAPDGSCAEVPLPSPMWGISRLALDQSLLDCAKSAGVNLLQPARCESTQFGLRPSMRVRMLEMNAIEEIEVDFIILADGKASLLPQSPAPTEDLGLKAHFSNVDPPADAIELFGVDGHYGGIAPIENGTWNIAFSVPASRIKASGGDLDQLFADIISENRSLTEQMTHARRVGDWLTSPLPRFGVTDAWPDRVIPVGNAAAALEPIGGEGMGLAMRSAELAANAILKCMHSSAEPDIAALRNDYRKLWNMRRFACRAGAKIFSSPALSGLAIPLARGGADGPGALALRLIGK